MPLRFPLFLVPNEECFSVAFRIWRRNVRNLLILYLVALLRLVSSGEVYFNFFVIACIH